MTSSGISKVWNLPNILTVFRIFLIPLFAVLLAYDGDQPPFDLDWTWRYSPGRLASLVVALAGVTDLLDGYLARKWKEESLLGKFLDPLADKLLLMVALIMLMSLNRVPAWLVIAILTREFLVTGLRGVAAGEGLIIPAGRWGKNKLILQMIGLGCLMWYGSFFMIPAGVLGLWTLYIALIISLVSGYHYVVDFIRAMENKRGQ